MKDCACEGDYASHFDAVCRSGLGPRGKWLPMASCLWTHQKSFGLLRSSLISPRRRSFPMRPQSSICQIATAANVPISRWVQLHKYTRCCPLQFVEESAHFSRRPVGAKRFDCMLSRLSPDDKLQHDTLNAPANDGFCCLWWGPE